MKAHIDQVTINKGRNDNVGSVSGFCDVIGSLAYILLIPNELIFVSFVKYI